MDQTPTEPASATRDQLTCCAQGAAEPAVGAFCIFCGTRTGQASPTPEPAVVPSDPDPGRGWDPREERALAKALSDMWDGHLGLWGRTENFTPDRQVFGLSGRDWIGELLRRGWVHRSSRDLRQLHVSEAGVQVVRAFRDQRGPKQGEWPLPQQDAEQH